MKLRAHSPDLISVIVPIYRVEKYLDVCIQSITSQTFRNLEIILVDDGSPDRCGAICDEWAAKDPRIQVIHKTNGGLSSARNAGLDIATGEYIAFIDSDDYIRPDMFERMYHMLSETGASLAICHYKRVKENENDIDQALDRKENNHGRMMEQRELMEMFLDDCFLIAVFATNKLFRRDLFDGIRFPEGKLCEDGFVMHEVFGRCTRGVITMEPLYYYRSRPDSILGAGLTTEHLSHLEAGCNRVWYFEKNGFQDLCAKATGRLVNEYVYFSGCIPVKSETDKQRYAEIRNKVNACYSVYGSQTRMSDRWLFRCYWLVPFLSKGKRTLSRLIRGLMETIR